ncbi:LuxR family transcriptional regulator [Chryseobacterium sp. L7]|uniref:LuxR family transcriptional regulator n=1 Tax=Chryseobacterium endalhagicum TaxID=2797638 RepID=A0ABS1QK12_9FLAO|nr:LuxR C-terminal-related transcriptional regulator [Chryseobacterium endalhagicum]MBL1222955.1 LuxR family transcriptional regulator [Chryseobacterium endalhagicum]
MKKIHPISTDELLSSLDHRNNTQIKYYSFFEEKINSIADHAISTYFWILLNRSEWKIEMVSENIEQFTPTKKDDWIQSFENHFYMELYHPEDREYLNAAFQFAEKTRLSLPDSKRGTLKFNFYGRMRDRNNEYRLVMIKSIGQYINDKNEIEASLVVIYDISHFKIPNLPLFSVIDDSKETQYYKYIEREIKNIEIDVPKISKREKQILELICSGYNTPQIALKLSISYYTVENHKQNLRKKTNTKTSSELVAFVMIHNLI